MIAPVSVIVPSYGPPNNPYSAFVGRFLDALAAMDPRPAEVVVAHSTPEPLGLLRPWMRPVEIVGVRVEDFAAAGIAVARQPWLCCVGVDDALRPDAFADIAAADAAGAEILLWDHHDGEQRRRGDWNPIRLLQDNTVHGSCPFRKSLFVRAGGFPRVAWSDWGFWLRCAKVGAIVHRSDRVGIDWDPGHDRDTFTRQATADPAILAARNAEIGRLVTEEILR